MGLIAVERFDPSKETSTYASWWIKQSIRKPGQPEQNYQDLPVHMVNGLHKFADVLPTF